MGHPRFLTILPVSEPSEFDYECQKYGVTPGNYNVATKVVKKLEIEIIFVKWIQMSARIHFCQWFDEAIAQAIYPTM